MNEPVLRRSECMLCARYQLALSNPSAESTPVMPQPPFPWPVPLPGNHKLHYSHFKAAPSLTAPFKSATVTAMLMSFLTLTFKTFLITDGLCIAVELL